MNKDFHNEPGYQSETNKPVTPSLETTDPSYRPGQGGGSRTGALILSVIAILIAIGVCIFTWVVYKDMSKMQTSLENKNTEISKLIQQASSKIDTSMQAKQQQIQMEVDKLQQQMSSFMSENTAQLEHQKKILKQNIDATMQEAQVSLQKFLKEAANRKQQWNLDQIEYMIRLANLNLTLGTNDQQTLQLLEMADTNLAQIKNPAFNEVRKSLANDITQLKAAPTLDVIGLITKINAISDQVQQLSILPNKQFTANPSTDKTPPDTSNTWREHVNKTVDNLRSMFVVRKLDGPVAPLLTPVQLEYLKENIRLKLSQAEWAALHQESALYRENLGLAKEWLNNYSTHDPVAVKGLQNEITELEKINVNPNRPNLLTSVAAIDKALAKISAEEVAIPVDVETEKAVIVEEPTEKPAEKTIEQQIEKPVEKPAEKTIEQKIETPVEKPAVEPVEKTPVNADENTGPELSLESPSPAIATVTTPVPSPAASQVVSSPADQGQGTQGGRIQEKPIPGFVGPESASESTNTAVANKVEQELETDKSANASETTDQDASDQSATNQQTV